MHRLEALEGAGIGYALLSLCGGPPEQMRRFAREIMPAFAAPAGG